jgi:hypothetical protein
MKKSFILGLTFLVLQACSSSDNNESKGPEEVVVDNIKPPYTVRYEVNFSSSEVNYNPQISNAYEYPKGTWRIASAPGTTAYVSKNELINSWTKEFTVTVDNNPLRIQCSVYYNPVKDATVITKMYFNNKLVKETKGSRKPSTSSIPTYYDDYYDVY